MPEVKKYFTEQLNKLHNKVILKIGLLAIKKHKKCFEEKKSVALPNEIWKKIFDYCSPFDLLKLQQVCKDFETLVTECFRSILYLDVYRIDPDDIVPAPECEGSFFVLSKAQLLLHIDSHRVSIFVKEQWTSRDVCRLYGAIRCFGRFARTVSMDASVFELTVAGLSSMELTRWHAFQCYLKAFNGSSLEDAVHVHCVKSNTNGIMLPKLKELTVRVLLNEFPVLSRLMDYGVTCHSIYSVDSLESVRLTMPSLHLLATDSENPYTRRRCNRHVKAFKHWLDASALREKYSQKYF